VPIALTSVNLSFLELSGPVKACNGIALPLHLLYVINSKQSDLVAALCFYAANKILFRLQHCNSFTHQTMSFLALWQDNQHMSV
jgi:hypothetical protein